MTYETKGEITLTTTAQSNILGIGWRNKTMAGNMHVHN